MDPGYDLEVTFLDRNLRHYRKSIFTWAGLSEQSLTLRCRKQPSIACLTDATNGCKCCRSTLPDSGVDGSRNIRRNTSIILRRKVKGKDDKTILVDCGKSFYQSAISHFPRKKLRQIDAVILTHPHADAINGLDDLRSWTLRAAVQKSVAIYCDQSTYDVIATAFPYLTSHAFATGGGDLPEIDWNIIDHNQPFDLFGITITPFLLHHGKNFKTGEPFPNLGLKFDDKVVYIGDASAVPEESWAKIHNSKQISNLSLSDPKPSELPILIVDCLKLVPFSSHYGIGQSMRDIVHARARRSYLLGFAHRVSHDCWLQSCKALSSKRFRSRHSPPMWPEGHSETVAFERRLIESAEEDCDAFQRIVLKEVSGWIEEDDNGDVDRRREFWLRPAYDGLSITISEDLNIIDDDDDIVK